jgi:RNA polymerase sigma-70 factor, ECF subfamily
MSDKSLAQDVELMRRVVERDQAAFEAIYEQYAQLVHRMAQRILEDSQAAEEVMQDVFFQLWRWPERWNPEQGTFLNWLLTVTRHTAIDQYRRRSRRPTLPVDQLDYQHDDSTHFERHSDNQTILRNLLRKLPVEQRQVIVLAFLKGMTHEEISDHLNIPLGTAKSRLRLGMQKLREAWQKRR